MAETFICRCSIKKCFGEVNKTIQNNACNGFFFDRVVGLQPETYFEKKAQQKCFAANFVEPI